jgi:NAD+ synthase (glutamine-hydrolysing)
VNQFGGQDSLVFDGGGYVNQNGRMLFEAARWREGWSSVVVDVDRTRRRRRENTTYRSHAEAYLETHEPVRVLEAPLPGYEAPLDGYPVPVGRASFSRPGTARPLRRSCGTRICSRR